MEDINYNEEICHKGLDLNLHIDFIKSDKDPSKMKVLICSVSKGYRCIDYAFVYNQITLADIIKEFMEI